MTTLPSLVALRAFEAAARHRNLTSASQELGITKSAISHQLRQLELYLGVKLFVRHSRGIQPTAEGETLLHSLGEGLKWFRAGVESVRRRKPRVEVIRISASPLFSALYLIPRLPSFHERNPAIRVRITPTLHLEPGGSNVDGVIRWVNPIEFAHYQCDVILRDKVLPVASAAFVEKMGRPRNERDFLRFPLIEDQAPPNEWTSWFAPLRIDYRPKLTRVVLDTHALLASTLSGGGIALVRAGLLSEYIETGVLNLLSQRALNDGRAYCLITADERKPEALGMFKKWLLNISRPELRRCV